MKTQQTQKLDSALPWIRRWRGLAAVAVLSVLTACGGGGGAESLTPMSAVSQSQTAVINPSVKIVPEAEVVPASATVGADGSLQIGVTKAQSLNAGDVVMIAPGASGLTNAFAGKVVSATDAAGNSTLILQRAGLADVFTKLKINYDSTQASGSQAGLRVSRVIAAPGVTANFVEKPVTQQVGLYSELCKLASQTGVVTFTNTLKCNGNKGTLSGELSISKEIGLTKTGTGEKVTGKWEAYFNLEDVKQVLNTNFDDLENVVTSGSENFHLEISGKAKAGMRISTPDEKSRFTFNVSDWFKEATGETLFEDLEWKLKYAEVSGLNADDKKGLIPVAGLVIDATCIAATAATSGAAAWKACGFTGALQNTVNFQTVSKPLSFILWAYINAKGELKLTGSFDIVKMEGYEFKNGFDYTRDGGAKLVSSESKAPTISMLNVNGTADASVTVGAQLAVDALIGGIRPAAVHFDLFKYTQNYHVEGKGGLQVSPSWAPSGEICHYGGYEVATQLTVLAKIKAKIGTPGWFALESGFEYKSDPKKVWASGTAVQPACVTTATLSYTLSRLSQNPNNAQEWMYRVSFPISYNDLKASVGKWRLKLDDATTLDVAPDENGAATVVLPAGKFFNTELQGFHVFEEKDTVLGTVVEALEVKANHAVQTPDMPAIESDTPQVGKAVLLWLNTTLADIKTVLWNFGAGVTETVTQGIFSIKSFSVSTVFNTPGVHSVTATYRDAAGTLIGSSTADITAFSAKMPTVTITNASSDTSTQPGPIASNGRTDDATPTLSGTLSAELAFGQHVNVYDGSSMFVAPAIVSGLDWMFTPAAPLTGGEHSFTAEAAGFDGTPGKRSAAFVVNVIASGATATGKLPDTGITASQCYQAGSDVWVSCTSAAAIALNSQQDGMVGRDVTSPSNTDGKLGFSYSTVGSYAKTECVKDNITGLTWEGKTATGTRVGSATYTNYGDSRSGDASAYVTAVNATALCGYTDWRLPTVDELQSLVDYSVAYPGPTIDTTWFPNTPGGVYWSASPYAGNAAYAWFVYFGDGNVNGLSLRVNNGQVRLVR